MTRIIFGTWKYSSSRNVIPARNDNGTDMMALALYIYVGLICGMHCSCVYLGAIARARFQLPASIRNPDSTIARPEKFLSRLFARSHDGTDGLLDLPPKGSIGPERNT